MPADSRYNMLTGDGKCDRDMRQYKLKIEGINVAYKTGERLDIWPRSPVDQVLEFCGMLTGLSGASLSLDSDLTRAGVYIRGHCMQRHVREGTVMLNFPLRGTYPVVGLPCSLEE